MESSDDFELLLDAALGLETAPGSKQLHQEPAPGALQQQQQHLPTSGQEHGSNRDGSSPHCSPTASPLHAPGSPCMSCDSSISWAAPEQCEAAGCYSPVREDPPREPHTTFAAAANGPDTSSPAAQLDVCFTSLPREVLMRVLCQLPADALTTLAQTCQQLRGLSGEQVLWRRLFCFRWGKKGRQQNPQQSWKARYIERDLTELQAAAGGAAADAMQEMFVQAHLAKRQQALPRAAVDDLMLLEDDEVAARVLAWRKARGFDSASQQGPPGSWQDIQRPADLGQHIGLHPAAAAAAAAAARSSGHSSRQAHRAPGRSGLWKGSGSGSGGSACSSGSDGGWRAAAVAAGQPAAAAAVPASAAGATAAAGSGHSIVSSQASGGSSAAGSPAATRGGGVAGGTRAASVAVPTARRVRQRRRWTQIGNVFCDEMTGWVHVCDDECCSERIVEPGSGLLVCPISGRTTDRMMTCAEEAEEEGEEGRGGGGEEDYGGERGRLARAFAAGYYCSNERELMRECGVRLSR